MKFHERTHTGEKAYKCTKCDNTSLCQITFKESLKDSDCRETKGAQGLA